ncbi:MAG: class I SAM-dependent methyltransferase [Chloroflexota bacterium]|nr:MAG: class I SAM-dependent methyltransferase [Chloroflexota bacterium]
MDPEEYGRMRQAEDGHWWYVGMRSIVDSLLSKAMPTPGLTVLDAGCGTGANLVHLGARGQVVGLDLAEEALSFCRLRGSQKLTRGSIQTLPFRQDCFDLVVSFDVLYHRAVSDDVVALREFRRVLRPDGLLLLRLPAFHWLRSAHDKVIHTRHRYTTAEVRDRLTAAGFAIERLTYVNFLLFPAAVSSRLLARQGGEARSDLGPVPPLLNRGLCLALHLESRLVRHLNLPWGLSVMALARKGIDT